MVRQPLRRRRSWSAEDSRKRESASRAVSSRIPSSGRYVGIRLAKSSVVLFCNDAGIGGVAMVYWLFSDQNLPQKTSKTVGWVLCKLSPKSCNCMLYLYQPYKFTTIQVWIGIQIRKQNRSLGIELWVAGINSKSRDCPKNPSWPTRRHAGLRSSRHPLRVNRRCIWGSHPREDVWKWSARSMLHKERRYITIPEENEPFRKAKFFRFCWGATPHTILIFCFWWFSMVWGVALQRILKILAFRKGSLYSGIVVVSLLS